jgi:cell division protein FtsI (penicillin-binding protein 3)
MDQRPRHGSSARLLAVGVVLVAAWTAVGYRLTVVQGARAEEFAARGLDQRLQRRTLPADRGTIFDRDGGELAVSIESVSVYANPLEMQDPARVASLLAPLVDRPMSDLLADFTDGSAFVYVARRMDPAAAEPIRDAELPGIYS